MSTTHKKIKGFTSNRADSSTYKAIILSQYSLLWTKGLLKKVAVLTTIKHPSSIKTNMSVITRGNGTLQQNSWNMLPQSHLQSSITRHKLLQQKNLITRIAKRDQLPMSQVWPTNISIALTTVLKMTKSSSIVYIILYIIVVVSGVTNKYIYDDSTIIKITKVVLSYISIINVPGATNNYI